MVGHVTYEITMLRDSARLLRTGALAGPISNAVLEAALVHLRNLDDFLGGPTEASRSDDVYATDFLPGWSAQPVLTEEMRQDVNKRVHHLTTRRIGQQHLWPLDLCEYVLLAAVEFLDQLQRDRPDRAKWFTDADLRWDAIEYEVTEVGS